MRFDIQVFYILIAIGVFSRKLNWKGWFGIAVFVAGWVWISWYRR